MKYTTIAAFALTLSGCQPAIDVFTSEAEAKHDGGGGGLPRQPGPDDVHTPCGWQHAHREYGVFATDDSPVEGPELADLLLECKKPYGATYHAYCEENRIKGGDFRIGYLPDDIIAERRPNYDFNHSLKALIPGEGESSEKNLRVAFIFTGQRFGEQLEDEATRCIFGPDSSIPSLAALFIEEKEDCAIDYPNKWTASREGYDLEIINTRAGRFYQIHNNETEEDIGMLAYYLG